MPHEIKSGQADGKKFECLEAQYVKEYQVKVKDALDEGFSTKGAMMQRLAFPCEVPGGLVLDGSMLRFRYFDRTDPETVYEVNLFSADGISYRGQGVTGDCPHELQLTHYQVGGGSALHLFHGRWEDEGVGGDFWVKCRGLGDADAPSV